MTEITARLSTAFAETAGLPAASQFSRCQRQTSRVAAISREKRDSAVANGSSIGYRHRPTSLSSRSVQRLDHPHVGGGLG